MFYCLPPAGDPIIWKPADSSEHLRKELFAPRNSYFFNSGAQALAAAITAIVLKKSIPQPEVLLPAYACPELVSAVLYAGARPVLVDLEPRRPWLSLTDLQKKINANTVAVIAVHLFGLPERLTEITQLCQDHDAVLIEDSAQAFPVEEDTRFGKGDMRVLSFGRGKPVSVMGGGALLFNDDDLNTFISAVGNAVTSVNGIDRIKYRIKVQSYNLLLNPRLYFIPASLPFLKLGETVFKPMHHIESINEMNLALLAANIAQYRHLPSNETQQRLTEMLRDTALLDLATTCCGLAPPKLIRYPVLAESKEQRGLLYDKLKKAGLGATILYQRPLNQIAGLEDLFKDQGDFPNAKQFADTLLTLPVHGGVTQKDIHRMKAILAD